MFRITRVDPLRIEIVVPAEMFGIVKKGMIARVKPDLPESDELDADIILVDEFVDAASNTFRVRASLPNSDGKIPAGSRCTAQLIEGVATVKNHPEPVPSNGNQVSELEVNLRLDGNLSIPKEPVAARRKVKQ